MIYDSIESNWEKTKETKCVCVVPVTCRPSLFSSMVKSFGFPFFMASLLKLIHDICQFVGPVMLSKVIDFLEDDDPNLPKVAFPFSFHRQSTGYTYGVIMFVAALIQSICLRNYFYLCFRTGLRLRSSVVTMVYV